MPAIVAILLGIVAAAVAVTAAVYLVVPVFKGIGWCFRAIGWLIAHVFRFVFNMISDIIRAIGAILTAIVFVPMTLATVLFGRWSAAAHFGRALNTEIGTFAHCVYRVAIGHPARFLLLDGLTEGIERRVPQVMAQAPGSDKPSKKTGQFPGYTIVGSLRAGGSGGKLYVATPDAIKAAAFVRAGLPDVSEVVIKSFSIDDGSSLPQIIRESRALEAARRLQLVLDHELTNERFFYVMPYVPGDNLTVRTAALHARAGGPGLETQHLQEAVGYVIDLLHTLDRYHQGGLWHKDIKPDNIIVHDGEAHLVDLGLVTPLRSAMTLTTHGTEYFRDPELVRLALRGVKVHEVDGVKFDIYGAGAVLYSIVENSFPAHGGLSQISKRCPDAVKWIIRRSMTDLNQRYPSARHMLTDLAVVASANDPFALKPADLPSMKGDAGDAESPAIADAFREPIHVKEPAVAFAAHTPVPPPQPVAPVAPPTPGPQRSQDPPKIKILDWWTGRYEAREPGREQTPIGVRQARHAAARRHAGVPGRPASEQLANAKRRVEARQKQARTRMSSRHAHLERKAYSNGPNAGVGIAVFVLLIVVAGVVGGGLVLSERRSTGTTETVVTHSLTSAYESSLYEDKGQGRTIKMVVDDARHSRRVSVGPRGDWDRNEKELAVGVLFADGSHHADNGYEADDVARDLFSAGRRNARVLFVSYVSPESETSPNAPHFAWLFDLLDDINATVLGFGDEPDEIDIIAEAQHTIGTSLPGDRFAIEDLRQWMPSADLDGIFWIAPDSEWHFVSPHDDNLERLYDEINARFLPEPKGTSSSVADPFIPNVPVSECVG